MISYIVSIALFFLCTILTILNQGIICIEETSGAPLALLILTLYLSLNDILFKKSGQTSQNTGDNEWTYEEKVKMYKIRGLVFFPTNVLQLFLLFTFENLAKIFLSSIIFIVGFGIAVLCSYLGTRKMVLERLDKEDEELKQQQLNEEIGRMK